MRFGGFVSRKLVVIPQSLSSFSSTAHPKSLMSQARLAVRKLLKRARRARAIDQLEIPPVLVNYLKHQ